MLVNSLILTTDRDGEESVVMIIERQGGTSYM